MSKLLPAALLLAFVAIAAFFFFHPAAPLTVKPEELVVAQTIQPQLEARGESDVLRDGEGYLRTLMKDPSSAVFDGLFVGKVSNSNGKSIDVACGYVNSKNSFGGFSGRQRFVASRNMAMTDETGGGGLMSQMWAQSCAPYQH